ncbi:ankyrin repeat domain-containing protein [Acidovorax sp. CCYZU-2555]|uniref:ankyrin repeat domain-containing protein n=1 Tax=Acidovorax sp. CCYZU-2555 TaxID=2835042 RepID=UPI001BD053BD|nr:ankyrin repeat domain-containing protein [Acidovorax sp. CCYZU-2555]MBS7781087.1 ankyrin repeat domain-containing protein [Acidovorax sp. CCYZU-2555]
MPIDQAAQRFDAVDLSEPSELMLAVQRGKLGEVQALIAAGADVNATYRGGITAFLYAADGGHDGIMRALIAAGADIHAADCDGVNALMLAANANRSAAVKCLLERGVDVNARDKADRTALMYTRDKDSLEVLDSLLLAGARVDAADDKGMTMLMQASLDGAELIMARLLSAGANADGCNASGSTPLMYAVDGDEGERGGAVKLLLSSGASINAVDRYGNSAAMRAALEGKLGLIDILQEHGANMDLPNCHGLTPKDILTISCRKDGSEPDEEHTLTLPKTGAGDTVGDWDHSWLANDDVLNRAFDESMHPDWIADMQQTPVAEAVGTRSESP